MEDGLTTDLILDRVRFRSTEIGADCRVRISTEICVFYIIDTISIFLQNGSLDAAYRPTPTLYHVKQLIAFNVTPVYTTDTGQLVG